MTNRTYNILLCDDDQKMSEEWHRKVQDVIPSHCDVLPPPEKGEVQQSIKELFARETSVGAGGTHEQLRCVFDEADILILDYDLLYVDQRHARHTGESLARLARTFSNVRLRNEKEPVVSPTAQVVVVVNQFQDAQFDLSLRGHVTSHADFNLDAALLDEPGLWADLRKLHHRGGSPWAEFRPWHWQTLFHAADTQAARQDWVHRNWREPIVGALGMRDDDVARLTDTAFGFIAPKSKDGEELQKRTFEDFARSPGSGANGAALVDQRIASRFVGARIGKWLERLVLGPQDALIDLPHLVQRFPFLLGNDVKELEAWNAVIHDSEFVKGQLPEKCLFEPSDILSRPAVWSHRFENDEDVRERCRSFDFADVPAFVFLEDTSSFAPIKEATQFRAGHHNAFDRRFVKYLSEDYTYAPQRRLAFAE